MSRGELSNRNHFDWSSFWVTPSWKGRWSGDNHLAISHFYMEYVGMITCLQATSKWIREYRGTMSWLQEPLL